MAVDLTPINEINFNVVSYENVHCEAYDHQYYYETVDATTKSSGDKYIESAGGEFSVDFYLKQMYNGKGNQVPNSTVYKLVEEVMIAGTKCFYGYTNEKAVTGTVVQKDEKNFTQSKLSTADLKSMIDDIRVIISSFGGSLCPFSDTPDLESLTDGEAGFFAWFVRGADFTDEDWFSKLFPNFINIPVINVEQGYMQGMVPPTPPAGVNPETEDSYTYFQNKFNHYTAIDGRTSMNIPFCRDGGVPLLATGSGSGWDAEALTKQYKNEFKAIRINPQDLYVPENAAWKRYDLMSLERNDDFYLPYVNTTFYFMCVKKVPYITLNESNEYVEDNDNWIFCMTKLRRGVVHEGTDSTDTQSES